VKYEGQKMSFIMVACVKLMETIQRKTL